ncbi:MAG: 4Fe-4S dicluster domain-containing protein [Pseudomonadota bacterium]
MAEKRDIQRESEMDLSFLEEVRAIPGGEKIVDCIQCGTCSGSCPTSYLMEDSPRNLFYKIRAGLREEVLKSPDIWLCTSCYFCYVRCPKNIKVTDIMYALKRLSSKERFSLQWRGFHLAKSFMKVVNRYGRNNEMELLLRFFLKTNPFALLKNMTIGLRLWLKGRLPLTAHKIKGRKQFRAIVMKAESMS